MDFPKTRKEGITRGTSKAIACPWCGEANKNLEDVTERGLHPGLVFECDFCNNQFVITGVNAVVHCTAERYGEMLHRGHLK